MITEELYNKDIFVVVPTYNENNEILHTLVSQLIEENYTVVVVDDGSMLLPELHLNKPTLHIIRHKINLGQGAALQTGSTYAIMMGAKYIVHFDADGQHLVSDIPTLINPLLCGKSDVVFGTRFHKTATLIPANKRILLRIARFINYIFTGVLLTDAHNGLRAFTSDSASKLQITENRMAHASEILFLVKKNTLRFTEVPVHVYYTDYSKQKGQSAWNSIRIVFDLLLHKLFE